MSHQQGPQQPARPGHFEELLAGAGRALDEVLARFSANEDGLRATRNSLYEVQRKVTDMDARLRQLDQRFTELLAQRYQEEHSDTLTDKDLGQPELADQITTLFVDLDHEHRQAWTEHYGEQRDLEDRAKTLAFVTKQLFGLGTTDISGLVKFYGVGRKRMIVDFETRARTIRERAASLAADHSFVFSCESENRHIVKGMQKPWATCDPDGEVEFVVTPAYIVGRRTYVPQQVFTRSLPAAGDGSAVVSQSS